MKIKRSKTGLPLLSESGGSGSSRGTSWIVCGPRGEPLKPLFTPKGYAFADHAFFVVRVGMHIIECSRSRGSERVIISRVADVGTDADPDELELVIVAEWEGGDGDIPSFLSPAVDAAREKAACYHCRHVHYAL